MSPDEEFEFNKIVIHNFILEDVPIKRTGILNPMDLPTWKDAFKDKENYLHVDFKFPGKD